MPIHRLKLLALAGVLNHIDTPSDESGGGTTPADESGSGDSNTEESGAGERDESDEDEGAEGGEGEDSDEDGDEDFKPITSKTEFERILGKRLHRERAKFADYDDIKKQVVDKDAEIAQLREQLGERDLKDMRKSIAEGAGVPENILRGTTEAELKAHAEELKAAFGKTEEDERAAIRRAAVSPHTGTGGEKPAPPSQEQGRESARAYLNKTKQRKDKG